MFSTKEPYNCQRTTRTARNSFVYYFQACDTGELSISEASFSEEHIFKQQTSNSIKKRILDSPPRSGGLVVWFSLRVHPIAQLARGPGFNPRPDPSFCQLSPILRTEFFSCEYLFCPFLVFEAWMVWCYEFRGVYGWYSSSWVLSPVHVQRSSHTIKRNYHRKSMDSAYIKTFTFS